MRVVVNRRVANRRRWCDVQMLRLRAGFTLIELLVVMTIISSLVLITMTALRAARADAEAARTRTTINKIHQVIAAQWQDYLTRPMPLRIPNQAFNRDAMGNPFLSAREMARVRLICLRELMRMEFPDCAGDVLSPLPVITIGLNEDLNGNAQTGYPTLNRDIEFPAPPMLTAIQRKVAIVQAKLNDPNQTPNAAVQNWFDFNANAELLYLIVENSFIDGSSALELFHRSEIGDTDSDGLNEFIDAWGRPICFIRWPAGYSGIQNARGSIFDLQSEFSMNGELSLDPFDPLLADWGHDPRFFVSGNKPFRPGPGLFPLIISAGPKTYKGYRSEFEQLNLPERSYFGIRFELDGATCHADPQIFWTNSNLGQYLPTGHKVYPAGYYYPDPYFPRGDGASVLERRQGAIINQREAADNITNFDDLGGSL